MLIFYETDSFKKSQHKIWLHYRLGTGGILKKTLTVVQLSYASLS